MSRADKDKWNARYAAGAFASRLQPSVYLAAHVQPPQRGYALDLGCGAGRNAIYLAQCGYQVEAIDIADVGLYQAAQRAQTQGVAVAWRQQDLQLDRRLPRNDYQLIIMFRFVAMELLSQIAEHLAPDGCVIVEQHLRYAPDTAAVDVEPCVVEASINGPRNPQFRVPSGALEEALAGLQVVHRYEGLVTDPDGTTAALAQIVARAVNG